MRGVRLIHPAWFIAFKRKVGKSRPGVATARPHELGVKEKFPISNLQRSTKLQAQKPTCSAPRDLKIEV
jgi:hypothetical protein